MKHIKRVANSLVRHGIIDAAAIEDAENYDGGEMLARVNEFCREIVEEKKHTRRKINDHIKKTK